MKGRSRSPNELQVSIVVVSRGRRIGFQVEGDRHGRWCRKGLALDGPENPGHPDNGNTIDKSNREC